MTAATKEMAWPPPYEHLHLKVHGGLGDIIWVYQSFHNYDVPLFLSISDEHRSRPRRSGILADHLPNVCGWRFDGTTFCPNGQDWPDAATDPACAIGKKWSELGFQTNTQTPYRLECNRWLEGGRRAEGWLPDLPKVFHFPLEPVETPSIAFQKPYVVLHVAGWPDVMNSAWVNAARLFYGTAHVYIVGGSYDRRPRQIAAALRGNSAVTVLEDLPWADLYALLAGCDYCFGHASGFTAMADVMRCKGVVVNPRAVPKLTGTWNSPDNPGLLYVPNAWEFESAVAMAAETYASTTHTWPPTSPRGPRMQAAGVDDAAAVRGVSAAIVPKNVIVASSDRDRHPPWLASAVIAGCHSASRSPTAVTIAGCREDVLAETFREVTRSSKRPVITAYRHLKEWTAAGDPADFAVAYVTGDAERGSRLIELMWRRLGSRGTLLVGGEAGLGERLLTGFADTLGVTPEPVSPTTEWFYIHKRL